MSLKSEKGMEKVLTSMRPWHVGTLVKATLFQGQIPLVLFQGGGNSPSYMNF